MKISDGLLFALLAGVAIAAIAFARRANAEPKKDAPYWASPL
jgi:hypothetical protein